MGPDQTAPSGAVWSGPTLFVLPSAFSGRTSCIFGHFVSNFSEIYGTYLMWSTKSGMRTVFWVSHWITDVTTDRWKCDYCKTLSIGTDSSSSDQSADQTAPKSSLVKSNAVCQSICSPWSQQCRVKRYWCILSYYGYIFRCPYFSKVYGTASALSPFDF